MKSVTREKEAAQMRTFTGTPKLAASWSGPAWPGSEDFTDVWVIDSKSGIDNTSEEKSGKEASHLKKN